MFDSHSAQTNAQRALIIGAGVGGLATALRLQAAGHAVTVFDTHSWPGGKMRAVPSEAGPVDAGPTVLTMRHVFDNLFHATGAKLEDHVTLIREPLLSRHFWRDGSRLDLTDDPEANADNIEAFAGKKARTEFQNFNNDAQELFHLFDAPMMQAADPTLPTLARAALSAPKHLRALNPVNALAKDLARRFADRRLAQLFGRYATYVGGSPYQSPAFLALIWQAEASGVWRVKGGMHQLAKALANHFQALGGTLRLATHVARINTNGTGVTGITLANGDTHTAPIVVFNGDPRALATGALGTETKTIARQTRNTPRSLSARVWSFAASVTQDPGLAHHNVFFSQNPREEFDAIAAGRIPQDPTLYVCAEDRGSDKAIEAGAERFEIILNATPLTASQNDPHEVDTCRRLTFQTLAKFGLSFGSEPPDQALSTPTTFNAMFPASAGSLYGQSPHGTAAALKRPRARTKIPGLYLAGGGTHPGAGVPMAALSGRHAAEAIMTDHALT